MGGGRERERERERERKRERERGGGVRERESGREKTNIYCHVNYSLLSLSVNSLVTYFSLAHATFVFCSAQHVLSSW